MRNPKFRAYHKIYKKMYDVISLRFDYDGVPCAVVVSVKPFYDRELVKVEDIIIEQDTWIKDKNGREVYQGDIVAEHNGDIIGTIIQHPSGEWQIAWVGIFGGVSKLYDHRDICEVIGNIHQNKELLEKKNDNER